MSGRRQITMTLGHDAFLLAITYRSARRQVDDKGARRRCIASQSRHMPRHRRSARRRHNMPMMIDIILSYLKILIAEMAKAYKMTASAFLDFDVVRYYLSSMRYAQVAY